MFMTRKLFSIYKNIKIVMLRQKYKWQKGTEGVLLSIILYLLAKKHINKFQHALSKLSNIIPHMIEQKGMTFDQDFCYLFSFSSSFFF